MVRGLSAFALRVTIVLALLLSVSSLARGQDVLTLTTPGAGSIMIPTGDEWTNVTVQCWGVEAEGVVAPTVAAPWAAAAAAALTLATPTRCSSPGHITTMSALAAWGCWRRQRRRDTPATAAAAAEVRFGTMAGLKT